MKNFAPMLLIGATASPRQDSTDLLQNIFQNNRSKYLNLLGMDEDTEMRPHIDSAYRDLERAFREPSQRQSEYDIPVYHVTHDEPDPHRKYSEEKTRAPRPRHEIYPELTRHYKEESAK